ncbi:MAG: IS3 family transposase, partial [Candidatus Caenarcaniphilales bacterium]|nr:IS3 family transposase [Candidatus Caenarcaniphilales bacterium]
KITECNQVWSTDITYIQMARGFCYLTAVIDWHSRMILSHRVSNSMPVDFCIESLEEALSKYPKPEIFNTDQGSQFTSKEFTEILLEKGVRISMDGRGRATDNAIIERFWRSIKYEDIFLKKYESIKEVKDGVKQYIDFYNQERLHSAIEYQTPRNLYFKDISSNLIKF